MAKRLLVASFFTNNQEFQVLQWTDVREAAVRRGFDVRVLNAEDNGVLKIQQLFPFIHAPEPERPLGFIVQTEVVDGLERVARNAASAGIGWVLLNRVMPYLPVLRKGHPKVAISAVTTDNAAIGRIQARQFRALLPRGGSLLYLQGPPQTASAQVRLDQMQSGLRGSGIDVKVLPAEWTQASGEQAVAAWLRLKTSERFRPDLVGCQNDALALGAQKALLVHRPELAQVPYTGCDGLPQGGQRLVKAGQLAATIVVPSCGGPARVP
jgi:ribose transport system substrate-binding protein